MKAHMIRVTSEGSKLWGKWVCMSKRELGFTMVREEGPVSVSPAKFGWKTPRWWAGTNLDARANLKKLW